jgi:hypothetical protein
VRKLILISFIFTLSATSLAAAADYAYDTDTLLRDFVSPVTTKADRTLYGGTALSLLSLWYENSTNQQTQKDFSTSRPLGDTSKLGDVMGQLVPNAAYSLGMLGDYYFESDVSQKSKSLGRALFMFESSLYAGVVSNVLKVVVREPRPDNSDNYSFPSGHATTAFAFAGVIGMEHEWYYSVPAYALAAFVGVSRINDNKHYLHDVIGGAALGLGYAFGIWYNRHPEDSSQANLFILPTDDLKGSVAAWQTHF